MKRWASSSVQAKASIAYMIGNLVSKAMSVLTIPIFTRIMTTEDMGIGTTYQAWYTIIFSVVTLSLCSGSLNIGMMDYSERRDQFESACLTLSSLSGVFFIVLFLCLKGVVSEITTLDTKLLFLIFISMIVCPSMNFWYARQRYEYKYKSSVIVSCSVTFLSAIVSIICVFIAKKNGVVQLGNVRVYAQGCVLILFSIVFYILIMIKGKCYFNFKIWRYALVLSLPLIIHALSKNLLDISDRLMISSMSGKSEAGIYGTIYGLSSMPLLVWGAINTAIIPSTFDFLKEDKIEKMDHLYFPLLVLFGGVAVSVSLLAPEILAIFTTKEYIDYVSLVPAIISGVYFTALYSMYGNFLLYKKKTVLVMIATMISAACNIVLNYICIKQFGFVAAAYTTLFSFILLALMQGFMVRVAFKRRIVCDLKYILFSIFVTIICLFSTLIYDYLVLRIIIVLGLLFLIIVNKNKILSLIRK